MSCSYHIEEKYPSKQVAKLTYTLEKRVFAAATLKG